MIGSWPKDEIDHRDTNKTNNKWINLREADNTKNTYNVDVRKDNKLNIKGVQLDKYSGKYRARITQNKIRIFLGYYETKEKAAEAYKNAALLIQKEFAHKSLTE